jgi:16S rRNA (uracil1498-N3)-methyltransferase
VARAPAVSGLCRLDEWATGLSGEDARVVLDADGDPIADVVRGRAAACPAAWALAVGPEGGWSPDEIAGLAARGFVRASLGPSNLRVDTAAIGALAVVRALAG